MTDGNMGISGAASTEQKLKIIKIAGLVIGFLLPMLMLFAGIGGLCGFLLMGIVLYLIPRYTGTTDIRILTVYGVVFALLALSVGTFAVSMPMIEDNDTPHDNDFITDVDVTYDGTNFKFTAVTTDSKLEDAWSVQAQYYGVREACYGSLIAQQNSLVALDLAPVAGPDGTTTWSGNGAAASGTVYYMCMAIIEKTVDESGEPADVYIDKTQTQPSFITLTASHDDIQTLCLHGNAYFVSLMLVIFLIILYATYLMRRVIENARVKMEAEGRLYPAGYGRCKKCDAIVLPGETCCRKCGEYVEVPEEIRPHKVDFFECSDCGAEVPADADVCPRCGAKFDDEENPPASPYTECPECGAEVPAGMDSCPRCGKKLE